jgi:hypothetical protein
VLKLIAFDCSKTIVSGLPPVPDIFVQSKPLQLLFVPTFIGIPFKLNHIIKVIEPVNNLSVGAILIWLVPAPVESVLLKKEFKLPELPIEKLLAVQLFPDTLSLII